MTIKTSSDGSTCVDTAYYWQPLETAPMGVKVQGLSKYGVASYTSITPNTLIEGFYTHWAALPKVKKEKNT